MAKILIVEDSDPQRFLLASLLKKQTQHECVEAVNGQEALQLIKADKAQAIELVLLDLEMPEMDGREALPKIKELRADLPVIVLTATEDIREVVEMMKLGAADFLTKPPDIALLKQALARALTVNALRHEVQRIVRSEQNRTGFIDIVGYDGDLKSCVKLASHAAKSDITVMMTGESGVGKEVFARAIHGESARAGNPFIAVNCGALPRDLVESILFGHKKGAFTGAVADSLGKFREAEGGTLFLDEVAELPLEAQVKLLRALQQREIEPVGEGRAVPVNIRIIAATNRNPTHEVKRGRLREDLFYRLNVFPISIPPLRQRTHDLEKLCQHFMRHYALLENRPVTGMEKEALQWIRQHSWPGNVRELENKIYRAVLLCEGEKIGLRHLLFDEELAPVQVQNEETGEGYRQGTIRLFDVDGVFKPLVRMEWDVMQAALQAHGGNVIKAAEALQISKSTLYKRLAEKK